MPNKMKIATVTIPKTTGVSGYGDFQAGTYEVEMPDDYDVSAIDAEALVHDHMLFVLPNSNEFEVGDEVEGGEFGSDDYDYGDVVEVDGNNVTVSWRGSETRTTQHYSALREVGHSEETARLTNG